MRVFLSYSREDQSHAEKIYAFLKSIPVVQPWMDIFDILPGADWEYEIINALEISEFVILLLSTNSVNKTGYIQKEIREALKHYERRPPGHIHLIPIRLEFCNPMHPELKKLNWIDLFSDWDHGLSRLKTVFERSIDRSNVTQDEYEKSRQKMKEYQAVKDEKAKEILETLPKDLVINLGKYSEWLYRRDWWLPPSDYELARNSIPNWTKQAKSEWVEMLQNLGVLTGGDPDSALFTDLGFHLLGYAPWDDDDDD